MQAGCTCFLLFWKLPVLYKNTTCFSLLGPFPGPSCLPQIYAYHPLLQRTVDLFLFENSPIAFPLCRGSQGNSRLRILVYPVFASLFIFSTSVLAACTVTKDVTTVSLSGDQEADQLFQTVCGHLAFNEFFIQSSQSRNSSYTRPYQFHSPSGSIEAKGDPTGSTAHHFTLGLKYAFHLHPVEVRPALLFNLLASLVAKVVQILLLQSNLKGSGTLTAIHCHTGKELVPSYCLIASLSLIFPSIEPI